MTTAAPVAHGVDVNQTVGLNVHDILFRKKRHQKELANALNLSESVLSKKLHGESAWSATQVAAAAAYLGVGPGRLYEQVSLAYVRPNLSLLQGSGKTSASLTPLLHTVHASD